MPSQQSAYPSVVVSPKPAQPQADTKLPAKDTETSKNNRQVPRHPKGGSSKAPRVVPDRPIPTLGWPAFEYRLHLLDSLALKLITFGKVNRPPYIPEMTPHEHERYRVKDLDRSIRKLQPERHRIAAVLNSKSAGKTSTATYLAVSVANAIGLPTILIDTNENNGTTAKLLGVLHSDTVMLREAIKDRNRLKDFNTFATKVGRHANYPVFVIASNPNSKDSVSQGEFIDMVKIVHDNTKNLTVLDCGNGTSWPSNVGSVEVADDLIFVARADDEYDVGEVESNDTFDNMISTMDYYRGQFPEKVQKAFIVINAVRKGQDKKYCMDRIRLAASKINLTVEELGIIEERLFLIPYSKHVARNRVVNLDPGVLGYSTRIAHAELAEAIISQEAKVRTDTKPADVITATKELDSEDAQPRQAVLATDALKGA